MKSFARPIKLVVCWICILVLAKLAISYYPTCDNMETLWAQVKQHLPAKDYELCTVNERADGLLFYGVKELEHLTVKSKPYPTFIPTENISEEIREFIGKNEKGIFLAFENDEIIKIIEVLKKSGIEYHIIYLSSRKALIFPLLPPHHG